MKNYKRSKKIKKATDVRTFNDLKALKGDPLEYAKALHLLGLTTKEDYMSLRARIIANHISGFKPTHLKFGGSR